MEDLVAIGIFRGTGMDRMELWDISYERIVVNGTVLSSRMCGWATESSNPRLANLRGHSGSIKWPQFRRE